VLAKNPVVAGARWRRVGVGATGRMGAAWAWYVDGAIGSTLQIGSTP
jgi:hypothetical protein